MTATTDSRASASSPPRGAVGSGGPQELLPAHLRLDGQGGFWFGRRPRIGWRRVPPAVELPPAPQLPARPEPWQSMLLTALLGSIATVVSTVAYFAYGINPVMLAVSGVTGLVTLITIGRQLVQRTSTIKMRKTLTAEYLDKVGAFEKELIAKLKDELAALEQSEPPIENHVGWCSTRDECLWQRRPGHEDFLHVRLGTAEIPAGIVIERPRGGPSEDDDLRAEAERAVGRHRVHASGPLVLDLNRTAPVLGLSGERDTIASVARALLISLAAQHGPDDVRLSILSGAGEDARAAWGWAKWLPHAAPFEQGTGADALVACQHERNAAVLALLAREMERRAATKAGTTGLIRRAPAVVVLATDPTILLDSPAGQDLLARGPELDFHFIVLAPTKAQLPDQCQAVVDLGADVDPPLMAGEATFQVGADVHPPVRARLEGLAVEKAARVARKLSPLRPISSVQAGELPVSVHLADVLGLRGLQPRDVRNWWILSERKPTLRAVLGIGDGPNGEPATIELDLEREGPHGLIAGTTGAGKSELLLTLLLSLAWRYPPHRVAFLLVDYKGGAAFGPAANLPHTVGLVTDLDEQLAHRCLVSLKAELKRREHLLREFQAKDISAYQGVAGAPALPHLVVVIDELAQLLKEVPSFVDGLISIAQVGRSLGVHLILATQKPEGVVAGPIQANSNFRICLRVVDPGDSNNVLGSRDAADIPVSLPGRAYVRVAQQAARRFQSARVAGHALDGQSVHTATLFAPDGAPDVPDHVLEAEDRRRASDSSGPSDLNRLVEHICQTAMSEGVPRLERPWPEALPAALALWNFSAAPAGQEGDRLLTPEGIELLWSARPRWQSPPPLGWLAAEVGFVDRPTDQRREPLVVRLAETGHVLVVGTFGAGAGMALATLGTSLALTHGPDDLHIYGLDFGTHALRPLAGFPHCGGVAGANEAAKCRRLFRMLTELLAERQRLLGDAGATDWHEYRRRHLDERAPYVLVLLDNFASFALAHEGLVELLPGLLRDGLAAGIHIAIAADQMKSVPVRLAGLIEGLLVLRQSEINEVRSLTGLTGEQIPKAMPPGRGFWRGTSTWEVQVARPVLGEADEAPQDALDRLGRLLADEWRGQRAPEVLVLPTRAPLGGVVAQADVLSLAGGTPNGLCAAFALDDETLLPVMVGLDAPPTFLVAGPPRSGRSSALASFVLSLAQRHAPDAVQFYVAAPADGPLDILAGLPHVVQLPDQASAVGRASDVPALISALRAATYAAQDAGAAGGARTRHVLVLDDYDLLLRHLPDETVREIASLTGGSTGRASCAFLASGRLADFEKRYDDVVKPARLAGHALVLTPRERSQAESFGAAIPRDLLVEWCAGRGFYVSAGDFRVVQIALPEPLAPADGAPGYAAPSEPADGAVRPADGQPPAAPAAPMPAGGRSRLTMLRRGGPQSS